MPTTIYVTARGDGSWRLLDQFRRALGAEAESLVVQSNRDESGFYGSADVSDVAAAREAFAEARKPYPGLKAHLSAPPPEREEAPRRAPAQPQAPREPRGPRPPQEVAGANERGQRRSPLRQRSRTVERGAERDAGRRDGRERRDGRRERQGRQERAERRNGGEAGEPE
jgi:hypothetical protein